MKFTATTAALVMGFGAAHAAKTERTFAVLPFTSNEVLRARADPIVSPGKTSAHVHSIMGASNFGLDIDADNLFQSSCTNAKIKGDFSSYWTPSLYFHDKDAGTFEPVPMYYSKVYYFFDATDDEIKAFPKGLQIVGGEAMRRTVPEAKGELNLDPNNGEINAVQWTCPRSSYNPPSYPVDSDGSTAGIVSDNNEGSGSGFPFAHCDGVYSPLRADIHMPSCYNPEAGLTDYKNNMAYPTSKGATNGANCPEGWIHVPHLFFEVYWDTGRFQSRWTPNQGYQPFVLANGDATGFGLHADFVAAWDEDLLQNIIDTCNAGNRGMDNCPGLQGFNEGPCTIESPVDEKIDGVLTALPGNNPLAGWTYGASTPAPTQPEQPEEDEEEPKEDNDDASKPVPAPAPEPTSTKAAEPTPEEEDDEEEQAPAPAPATTEKETPTPIFVEQPEETTTSCTLKIHTVWETVTVYAEETAAPEPVKRDSRRVRRHMHNHVARHHGSN